MAKKIVVTVLVIVACVAIYYWYTNRTADGSLGSGNVFSSDSSLDLDGHPQVKPSPSRSDSPGTVNTVQVAPGSVSNQPPENMKGNIAGGQVQTTNYGDGSNSPPATDSASPNAPNGVRFGGNTRFQWYRQGNLTWRVDTGSGATCVAFATLEEWRKPLVHTHGCGNA
ncbi:MAG: hypothetical protein ABI142_09100 [Bryocella sp.]